MEILFASACIAAAQVFIWYIIRSRWAAKNTQSKGQIRAAEIAKAASNLHPFPIWATDQAGQIIWQNQAAGDCLPGFIQDCMSKDDGQDTPYVVNIPQDDQYTITKARLGPSQIYFARSPSASHKEKDRIIKTLASSFSNLPIGLAIFDENHTLHTFNPSLAMITSAKPEFLTQRPSIGSFFDHLRTIGFLSEPKDYKSWRKNALQHAETNDGEAFSQSWGDAEGNTFRMSIKPDVSGGVILFIEDVSQATNQTREQAWKRDIAYAALDAMDSAAILFDQGGYVTFCNAKYRSLWAHDPLKADFALKLSDCQKIWHLRADTSDAPGPMIEPKAAGALHVSAQSILLKSGQEYIMTTKRLRNRATLVEFTAASDIPDARMRA